MTPEDKVRQWDLNAAKNAEIKRLRAALDEARKFTVLQAAWGASNDHELNKSATDLIITIDKVMGEG